MFRRSAAFYDLLYEGMGKDYAAEAVEVDALIQRHRPGAATLLDVACGTGAHLEQLACRYRAVGLEVASEMLAVARQRRPPLDLVQADMRSFDLGRTFDAVACLFSSIGYMTTVADLERAVAAMDRHIAPGGVLMIEAWFEPDAWRVGHVAADLVEGDDMRVVRMSTSLRAGTVSVMDFHYLVGTPAGVEHFVERHEMGLFTQAEYEAAFAAAGLTVIRDGEALLGRGVFIGRNGG